MSDKYLVLSSDNEVVNVILWNGISEYNAGEGFTLELAPAAESNTFYNIGMFKQEDGLFYYKWSDGTFNLEQEPLVVE